MSEYNYRPDHSSGDKWNDHLYLIAKHYVDDHWSLDDIAQALKNVGLSTR